VRLLHDPQDPRLCFVLRVAAALRDKPKPPKPGCALRTPACAPPAAAEPRSVAGQESRAANARQLACCPVCNALALRMLG